MSGRGTAARDVEELILRGISVLLRIWRVTESGRTKTTYPCAWPLSPHTKRRTNLVAAGTEACATEEGLGFSGARPLIQAYAVLSTFNERASNTLRVTRLYGKVRSTIFRSELCVVP